MMKDKQLEKQLNFMIDRLEIKIDYIGPTPLRHQMSAQIVEMRKTLKSFDQENYEKSSKQK